MSQDIAEFLRARYTERRQKETGVRRLLPDAPPYEIVHETWGDAYVLIGYDGEPARPRVAVDEFNARYTAPAPDPFILADLDSKERILRELPGPEWHEPCASLVEVVLTLLAVPYADHPDYREEWRP